MDPNKGGTVSQTSSVLETKALEKPSKVSGENPYEEFAATLHRKLHALIVEQTCGRAMYRQAVEEWPIGRIPPEVKEKHKAELKELEELEGASDGSDSDNDSDGVDRRVGPEKGVATSSRLYQTHWLLTLPLSADSPMLPQHRTKRRRVYGEDKDHE